MIAILIYSALLATITTAGIYTLTPDPRTPRHRATTTRN